MEGRYPPAIRITETNCTDPAQEVAFNDWYNRIHVPDILAAGLGNTAIRYENAQSDQENPQYIAIYELATHDLNSVNERFAQVVQRLREKRRMHEALQIARRGMWRRIGPDFRSARAGTMASSGVWIIESNCIDTEREADFNRWYNEIHIPDLLATECFVAAYRFESQSGQGGGRYLALYETNGDPVEAVDRFVKEHRPGLKAGGRLSEIIDVTRRGVYRRLL